MGDHTETLQIDFDPTVISYERIMRIFFDAHNPTRAPWSRQYKSAVFCDGPEQLAVVQKLVQAIEAQRGAAVQTEVQSQWTFTRAEDYHQKYRLQAHGELMNDLRRYFTDFKDLVDSPTAMRLNSYLGRCLDAEQLNREIDRFGLSERGVRVLRKLVR